jgi:hypothetical protein
MRIALASTVFPPTFPLPEALQSPVFSRSLDGNLKLGKQNARGTQDRKLESQYLDFFHRQPGARRGFLFGCTGLALLTLLMAVLGFSTDGGVHQLPLLRCTLR